MFLFNMDYYLFQTYSLTSLPQKQLLTNRYSNLRILESLKKIVYGAYMGCYLSGSSPDFTEQTLQVLSLVLFFEVMWWVWLPFDPRK